MNDPYKPIKKPHGCWKWSGCMLTIVSALLIAFFVWMIIYSEQEIDKSRQEFTASQIEYEEALVVFILFLLIPFGIGLLMLLYYWLKYRKWRNNELFPK